MAEFPTYEQMAKNVAEKALDEFLYHGKSIREWIKIIVDQEPKTGHWIEHPHETGENWEYSKYECSECHEWAEDDSDFCPNCGAKMESEEE